jgi:hypothetical protein
MHMRGTGMDLEVEIYATKLAKETSPWTPMHGVKGELVKTVLTASAICGVKPWPSVMSYRSSLWNVDLIADNGDPDGRNVQTTLANRVDRASHMGRFFVFPISIGGAEVAETTVKKLLCCGFRHTGKAIGQLY